MFLSLHYCNSSSVSSGFVLFQSMHHAINMVISLPFGIELTILIELYKALHDIASVQDLLVGYGLVVRAPGSEVNQFGFEY